MQLSTAQVAAKIDVKERTLLYWCTHGLLHPAQLQAQGMPYRWSERDLAEAFAVRQMRASGMALALIRRSLEALRAGGWTPSHVRMTLALADGVRVELDAWDVAQLKQIGVSEQLVIPGWEKSADNESGDETMARSPE